MGVKRRRPAALARAAAAYSAKLMDKAGQMALQLKETQRDLDENKSQLTQAEALYKNLVRQRDGYLKEAKARIDVIKSKISKAEMAEAQAQLTEVANATAFSMGGAGASLGRLEEALVDRIANAAGKVRVATDSAASNPDFVVTEAEQNALEAQALAEFAAQMGLQAPAGQAAPAPAVSRDLGPELPDPALDPLKVPEG